MLIQRKATWFGIPEPPFISARAAHGPQGHMQRDDEARKCGLDHRACCDQYMFNF